MPFSPSWAAMWLCMCEKDIIPSSLFIWVIQQSLKTVTRHTVRDDPPCRIILSFPRAANNRPAIRVNHYVMLMSDGAKCRKHTWADRSKANKRYMLRKSMFEGKDDAAQQKCPQVLNLKVQKHTWRKAPSVLFHIHELSDVHDWLGSLWLSREETVCPAYNLSGSLGIWTCVFTLMAWTFLLLHL